MRKMNKYVGIMLLSIAFLLLTPIASLAELPLPIVPLPHPVVARYGTTPTIDGTISDEEWDDANTVTFTVTDGATCTVYVKQDGSYLYVAFNIPDTTYYSQDEGLVCLDVNHDDGGAYKLTTSGLRFFVMVQQVNPIGLGLTGQVFFHQTVRLLLVPAHQPGSKSSIESPIPR